MVVISNHILNKIGHNYQESLIVKQKRIIAVSPPLLSPYHRS